MFALKSGPAYSAGKGPLPSCFADMRVLSDPSQKGSLKQCLLFGNKGQAIGKMPILGEKFSEKFQGIVPPMPVPRISAPAPWLSKQWHFFTLSLP